MLSRRLKLFMLATKTRHARNTRPERKPIGSDARAGGGDPDRELCTELPPGANGFPVVPQTDSERCRRAEEDQGITSIDRARQDAG